MVLQTTTELDLPAIVGGEKAKRTPYGSAMRYGAEELEELREALEQNTLFYNQGKKVTLLEEEFAAKHGARFAIACSSGTSSIHSALIALSISPGDEVIVPPLTDMGTIAPILFQGAVPVFTDVTPHGYTLNPVAVTERITARTKAVIAVHLVGNACHLAALRDLCNTHNLALIEDCAQAFGCTYDGKAVGTLGQVGCFSYNEYKHISCGDGGIVITNDPELAHRLRLATDKCYDRRPGVVIRQPTFLANNYRMTELQAAVGRAQLRKLDDIVARRQEWCKNLYALLEGTPGIDLPKTTPGSEHSWWCFMLRIRPEELNVDADTFVTGLQAEGIQSSAHFIGLPIYRYPLFVNHSAFASGGHPYQSRDYKHECCPVAEAILETSIVLPVNEAFTTTDASEIADGIRRLAFWYAHSRE